MNGTPSFSGRSVAVSAITAMSLSLIRRGQQARDQLGLLISLGASPAEIERARQDLEEAKQRQRREDGIAAIADRAGELTSAQIDVLRSLLPEPARGKT